MKAGNESIPEILSCVDGGGSPHSILHPTLPTYKSSYRETEKEYQFFQIRECRICSRVGEGIHLQNVRGSRRRKSRSSISSSGVRKDE